MASQPDITRFSPQINSKLYGNHVPYDRGYGVRTPDVEAGKGHHSNSWNAQLIDPFGQSVKLWVADFSTSFELGGSTAQSVYTRQFFPRNFVQVTVKIQGQMPNSFQYNRLAAFVRNSQLIALQAELGSNVLQSTAPVRHFGNGSVNPTVQLLIRPGGPRETKHGSKGDHRGHVLEGYIKNIKAGAERFINVPEFEFDFVVVYSVKGNNVGVYEDSVATGSEILPWLDIFKKNRFRSAPGPNPFGVPLDTQVKDFVGGFTNTLGNLFGLL